MDPISSGGVAAASMANTFTAFPDFHLPADDFELISDAKLYTVHAKVLRRERVQTPAGTFSCGSISPSSGPSE
mgnify:CR=1 FL=1